MSYRGFFVDLTLGLLISPSIMSAKIRLPRIELGSSAPQADTLSVELQAHYFSPATGVAGLHKRTLKCAAPTQPTCNRRESNPHCRLRRPMFYPLNYGCEILQPLEYIRYQAPAQGFVDRSMYLLIIIIIVILEQSIILCHYSLPAPLPNNLLMKLTRESMSA